MSKRTVIIYSIAIATLLVGISGFWLVKHKVKSPESIIRSQLTFPVIQPKPTSDYKIDKQTIRYNPNDKVYSFIISKDSSNKLTVSLQPTPESFNDAPQVYDKLVEKLRQYATFDSVQGKVYLIHPIELNGGQTAIMNSKGTLMFIKPEKDLSDDDWKILFNALEISDK